MLGLCLRMCGLINCGCNKWQAGADRGSRKWQDIGGFIRDRDLGGSVMGEVVALRNFLL
jgi:hypothetical protein